MTGKLTQEKDQAETLQTLWRYQRLLPKPLSRRLHKALLKAGQSPEGSFNCDFYGLSYQGRFENNIDSAIYYYGAFEKPLLYFMSDALEAIAGERGVFIDIGANVGQHSLYMSRLAQQVIAFEPYAPVRERLEYHLELNAINNVSVHALGMSDTTGTLPFYAPAGSNAGIGSFDPGSQHKGNQAIGELHLVRGDEFFLGRQFSTPQQEQAEQIHLIKMDVEGFEKPALQGLSETLAHYRPLLICELTYGQSLSFTSSEELLAILPDNYTLLSFNKRRTDGSKRQRKNARARISGEYELVPYPGIRATGQDDVIACPDEYLHVIPYSRP